MEGPKVATTPGAAYCLVNPATMAWLDPAPSNGQIGGAFSVRGHVGGGGGGSSGEFLGGNLPLQEETQEKPCTPHSVTGLYSASVGPVPVSRPQGF